MALKQGEIAKAQALIEEIMTNLETGGLEGADDPFRVQLTCYRVLQAVQDDRAAALLARAYRALEEQASSLKDETTRRSFLENVPSHREIVSAWESSRNNA